MEIYLDNAATSFPKPESVYRAIEDFMRKGGGSPSRGGYSKGQESESKLIRLRSRLSSLLGIIDPSRLIFTANATDALNLALKGWLCEGDHVVTTDLEHNAVLRPLWGLRKTRQIDVTIVKSSALGEIDPQDFRRAVTPRTRLFSAVHASNVLGTILPIFEISKISRELQIPFLVDGSQTAGAIPINLQELDIDFFAFTGHKSLLGPTGTGGLYVKSGIELQPFREGGNGSHSEDLNQPVIWPERFESGTPNMLGLVGLLAGIEFLIEKKVEAIQAHETCLNKMFMENMLLVEGIKVHGPTADKKVGITSINFQSLDSSEIGQILGKKFGIMVRTGLHCAPLVHENIGTKNQGTVRFSVGWSTTPNEIEHVIQTIQEITKVVYRRNI